MSIMQDDDFQTFQMMADRLEKEHPNEVVAICDGKIIAYARTYKEALRKAVGKVGNRHIFLHRIGPYDKDAVSLF